MTKNATHDWTQGDAISEAASRGAALANATAISDSALPL
jgi:hypothetical protein